VMGDRQLGGRILVNITVTNGCGEFNYNPAGQKKSHGPRKGSKVTKRGRIFNRKNSRTGFRSRNLLDALL
jgi:hypothetical protein